MVGKDFDIASTQKERCICPLCGKEEESLDHLYLQRLKTRSLWSVLYSFSVYGCFSLTLVQELIIRRKKIMEGHPDLFFVGNLEKKE